jgi:hypothetical protein
MDHPELIALHEETLASCEGFNNKDVSAWMDPFHEDAVTYNDGFMPISILRPVADSLIESFNSFNISNVDGRIVGNTAVLFGDYVTEMADGTTRSGAFTLTAVKTNGEWKTLLTHYTPR